ncbi:MAG: zinc ribbon domain-containing protein [Bacillus sp. (in: Bacteria)]|nr:zinc ribbon domain-containing protein [Bacillus sp. (in: firmicutes)]
MYCHRCEKKLPSEYLFCPMCGLKLEKETKESDVAAHPLDHSNLEGKAREENLEQDPSPREETAANSQKWYVRAKSLETWI